MAKRVGCCLAGAAGVPVLLKLMGNIFKVSQDSSQVNFPPTSATVEASVGVQLMLVAALLIIFAASIGSADQEKQKTQTPMARRIACCLAGAAGLVGLLVSGIFGLLKVHPGNLQASFPSSRATVEASEGVQFMLITLLLIVFVAAIQSFDEKEHTTKTSKTWGARTISLYLVGAAGLLGLLKTIIDILPWASLTKMFSISSDMLPTLFKGGLLLAGFALVSRDMVKRARSAVFGMNKSSVRS